MKISYLYYKESFNFSPLNKKLELIEAWGIKMKLVILQKYMKHSENNFSGILYLNDAFDNKIFFP